MPDDDFQELVNKKLATKSAANGYRVGPYKLSPAAKAEQQQKEKLLIERLDLEEKWAGRGNCESTAIVLSDLAPLLTAIRPSVYAVASYCDNLLANALYYLMRQPREFNSYDFRTIKGNDARREYKKIHEHMQTTPQVWQVMAIRPLKSWNVDPFTGKYSECAETMQFPSYTEYAKEKLVVTFSDDESTCFYVRRSSLLPPMRYYAVSTMHLWSTVNASGSYL